MDMGAQPFFRSSALGFPILPTFVTSSPCIRRAPLVQTDRLGGIPVAEKTLRSMTSASSITSSLRFSDLSALTHSASTLLAIRMEGE